MSRMMPPEPPPPVAPPKGLAGMLEGSLDYDGAVLDTSDFPPNMVMLNVYDVSNSDFLQKVNAFTTGNNRVLVGGVFHAGVEIYGEEWCYGATEDDRTGVCAVRPRSHPQHTYRATVPMGPTQLTIEQVDDLVHRLAVEWPGRQYDLIHNNCLSFCNSMLKELGLRRIPGWIDRAARAASFLDTTSKKISADTRSTVQLVRTVSSELESNVRNMNSVFPSGDDETIDSLRRESTRALEVARAGSSQLATIAQSQVEVAQTRVQAVARELGGAAVVLQQLVGDATATSPPVPLLGQDLGDAIRSHALDFQERTQALGSGLWQIGQGLQDVAAPLADTITQAVASAPCDPAEGERRKASNRDVGLDVNGWGADDMFRACEERLLIERLLDDAESISDENTDSITTGFFSRAPPPDALEVTSPRRAQPVSCRKMENHGFADLLTGDVLLSAGNTTWKQEAAVVDLLTGD